ncbi:hypothetical protein BDZ45DRAFT_508709 [Acephala macrosclerotiorum]|nr:hypothetical protein BDZ45DRAFT_508709 [Acephala macrosclerotiorum]
MRWAGVRSWAECCGRLCLCYVRGMRVIQLAVRGRVSKQMRGQRKFQRRRGLLFLHSSHNYQPVDAMHESKHHLPPFPNNRTAHITSHHITHQPSTRPSKSNLQHASHPLPRSATISRSPIHIPPDPILSMLPHLV